MKVLFVCSGNFQGKFEHAQVFVHELMQSLQNEGLTCDLFLVRGNGVSGYLKNGLRLRRFLSKNHFDIVHPIYGLSGLTTLFQCRTRVVTSFIGSDMKGRLTSFSRIASFRSDHCIFVEKSMPAKLNRRSDFSIIPFGIDFSVFNIQNKLECRRILGIHPDDKIVLFASKFTNSVKNYPLASRAIEQLPFPVRVLELGKSFSREELNLMFNASDLLLMTSLSEGSPQVIKEAMACSLPIVSTDVGDVREITGKINGTFICSYEPSDVAEKIALALKFAETTGRTNGRERILQLGLDNKQVARKVMAVYEEVLKKKRNV